MIKQTIKQNLYGGFSVQILWPSGASTEETLHIFVQNIDTM